MNSERAALMRSLMQKQRVGKKLPIGDNEPPKIMESTEGKRRFASMHPEVLQHVHSFLDSLKKGLNGGK